MRVFCTSNGIIQYHSVKLFKQSITQPREGGRLACVHLVIDQVCYRFHTCTSESEPLLNIELSIEYARFEPPSICKTRCLHTCRIQEMRLIKVDAAQMLKWQKELYTALHPLDLDAETTKE